MANCRKCKHDFDPIKPCVKKCVCPPEDWEGCKIVKICDCFEQSSCCAAGIRCVRCEHDEKCHG